jgi:uncharacterized repeat protein (TIGR01451 family)
MRKAAMPTPRHALHAALAVAFALLFWQTSAWGLSATAGTSILNRASLSYRDGGGNPVPGESATAETVVSGGPVLMLTITESSDPVAMGAALVYTLAYANTGNADSTNTALALALSSFVTYQSSSVGGTHAAGAGGGTVSWTLGTLAPGASGTVTVTVLVKSAGDPSGIANGSVIVASGTLTSNETNAAANASTTVGSAPNLGIAMTGTPGVVQPGGTILYTISYSNTGNQTANNVSIRTQLPPGTALAAGTISGSGAEQNRAVSWVLGALAPGASGSVSFQVTVSPIAESGSSLTNDAVIISNELGVILSNQVTTFVRAAALAVTKTGLDTRPGENITYTINAQNQGMLNLTNVIIRDPLPAATTFVSADQGGVLQGGEVVWTVGSLGVGEEFTATLVLTVSPTAAPGAALSNTASVSSTESPAQSATNLTTVAARTQGRIEFYTSAWQRARSYHSGDTVCVQVTDYDQNRDETSVETVRAKLQNAANSDTENLTLTETGVSTGVFRGCVQSVSTAGTNDDSAISVSTNSFMRVYYTDALDPIPMVSDTVLIDPFGIVFDSQTGAPVPGAVVTLMDAATGLPAALPNNPNTNAIQSNPYPATAADGFFQFEFVPAGSYYLDVSPGGTYTYPSLVPDSSLPQGYIIGTGSKREVFTLTAGMEPLHLDVPVDPPVVELLTVTKSADRTNASIGDIIRYTIRVTNRGALPVNLPVVTDVLPHGIQYLPGSSALNGAVIADPTGAPGKTIAWSMTGAILPGASIEIMFYAVAGADSSRGDGKNTAYARGQAGTKTVTSNNAYHTLRITEGVFTSDGTILGRVFHDANGNGLQDKGEPGIAGIELYMENGTRVTTDSRGLYSINSVTRGTHLLVVDDKSLPAGLSPAQGSHRDMGAPGSRFVDMAASGLAHADFPLQGRIEENTPDPRGGLEAAPISPQPEDIPLEERIMNMTPALEILEPEDRAVVSSTRTRIMIKAPYDADLQMLLNGEPVSVSRVGRRIFNKDINVAVYEFVGLALLPGEHNSIEAQTLDASGAVTASKAVVVTASGAPDRILIQADSVPADGTGAATARVSVLDRNGNPIGYAGIVTVTVSAGEILDLDMNGGEPGVQLLYRDETVFRIKAPTQPGPVRVSVSFEDLTAGQDVYFTRDMSDAIGFAFGEIKIGRGRARGSTEYLKSRDNEWFDNGSYSGGRAAWFVKRDLGKGVFLTSSFDSAKRKRYDLMRDAEYRDDSESLYPIYGDDSETAFESQSQSKAYVRLDRGRSRLLYGDYQTAFTDTRLGAYTRTFNGANLEINSADYQLKAFSAFTDRSQVVDEMRGRGVSGYYNLSKTPVVDGSESIVIQTRDRNLITRVVDSQPMVRWIDYTVDYERGAILFKAPVPSHDAELNPVFIVVSYETEGGARKYFIYGARMKYCFNKYLTLGATQVTDEQDAGAQHLKAFDAAITLRPRTVFRYEQVKTQRLFNVSGVNSLQSGDGWLWELESRERDDLTWKVYQRSTNDWFGNPSASEMQRGMQRQGYELEFRKSARLSYSSSYFVSKDTVNEMDHRSHSVGMKSMTESSELDIELLRESSSDAYISSASANTRNPYDDAEVTPGKTVALRTALRKRLRPRLDLTASHRRDIQYNRHNITTAGLEFRLNQSGKLYVREELWAFEDRSGRRTVFGADAQVNRNTSAFNEYRIENGAGGQRIQRAIGLRNAFTWGRDLTGNVSVENLSTISGAERDSEPDAFALAAAAEYLPKDRIKISSRLEYRDATAETSRLAELGVAWKAHPDYSAMARQRYYETTFSNGAQRTAASTLLGLAWRPAHTSRYNGLMRLEFKADRSSPSVQNATPRARIFAIEGSYHPVTRFTLTGKYAFKTARSGNWDSRTTMVAARVLYDIGSRWDISGEYRALTSRTISAESRGGALELGYQAIRNLWLSAGYSYDAFDTDLTGDSYWGKGPYMKMRFKIMN